jgi:hypothetical protein
VRVPGSGLDASLTTVNVGYRWGELTQYDYVLRISAAKQAGGRTDGGQGGKRHDLSILPCVRRRARGT